MSIDKWKELNKEWLCKMFHKEETVQSYETWALCEIVDNEHPGISSVWHSCHNYTICIDLGGSVDEDFGYDLGSGEVLCSQFIRHFRDWKRPTQQEKDMYEMLTGVKIMWSEEHPFRTLEDE